MSSYKPITIPSPYSATRHVRSAAHRMGLRFRMNAKELPGEPHIVFPRHRIALFVCRCPDFLHSCLPAESYRHDYFVRTAERHRRELDAVTTTLMRRGWRVPVIWECEGADDLALERRLREVFAADEAGKLDEFG
jgi:DNA mismatch endonuclease, patch repair protein